MNPPHLHFYDPTLGVLDPWGHLCRYIDLVYVWYILRRDQTWCLTQNTTAGLFPSFFSLAERSYRVGGSNGGGGLINAWMHLFWLYNHPPNQPPNYPTNQPPNYRTPTTQCLCQIQYWIIVWLWICGSEDTRELSILFSFPKFHRKIKYWLCHVLPTRVLKVGAI